VHYAPIAEIVHLGGRSSRIQRRRNFLEYRRSLLRFFLKNHGRAAAEVVRCIMLAFLVLRIPYWAVRSLAPSGQERDESAQLGNCAAAVAYLLRPLSRILADDPRAALREARSTKPATS
jgi:hypothetical protein